MKKSKLAAIAALSLLGVGQARAELSIEDVELKTITEATGGRQGRQALEKQMQSLRSLQLHDEACHWQLSHRRLPYSCYRMHTEAEKLGVKASPNRANLDGECEKIARQTSETELAPEHLLPHPCEKLASDRVRLNRYKVGKIFD